MTELLDPASVPDPFGLLPTRADVALISDDGLFTRRDAQAVGISDAQLGSLVQAGDCRRLCRGLYDLDPPPDTPEELHLRLGQGGLLLYPDAQLSHVTAVIAHGVSVWGVDLGTARLARPISEPVVTQAFTIWPSRFGTTVTSSGPAVELADSLVQLTLEAGAAPGCVSVDHAVHAGLVTMADVVRSAAVVVGWPRSGRVTTMLAYADGRSESVGETRLRLICRAGSIAVTPQVVIRDQNGAFVARCDLGVDGTKILLEFDGKEKYRGGGIDAVVAEKQREDRLRALGYIVIRVVWAELFRPRTLVRKIRAAILAHA